MEELYGQGGQYSSFAIVKRLHDNINMHVSDKLFFIFRRVELNKPSLVFNVVFGEHGGGITAYLFRSSLLINVKKDF
jgi:hypothetical protein